MEEELEKGEIPPGVSPEEFLGGDITPNTEVEAPLSSEQEKAASETAEPEKAETSKEFQSLDAQKRHWREEAIDPETGRKYKDLYKELKTPKTPKLSSDKPLDLIKLGKKLEKYSEDEIDFITEHAHSDKPEDILKATENEMVQLAIEAKRRKVAEQNKVPAPSSSGSISGKSAKDIRKMPDEDFQKLVEETNKKQGAAGI